MIGQGIFIVKSHPGNSILIWKKTDVPEQLEILVYLYISTCQNNQQMIRICIQLLSSL